jgi:hypothetical protein
MPGAQLALFCLDFATLCEMKTRIVLPVGSKKRLLAVTKNPDLTAWSTRGAFRGCKKSEALI